MEEEKAFEAHLGELRTRLKHSVIVLVVLTGMVFYFSQSIIAWLQKDLMISLNALAAYEVLYTQLMVSLIAGFFLSLPVLIYHFLKFVKPGLKQGEYRILRNYLPFSLILFVTGFVFAYQVIVKSALSFFRSSTYGTSVEAVWGLRNTLGFALKLSSFTGVMFQLPIVVLVLSYAGLIDSRKMKFYRPYFFVSVLLLAAFATPPDIITQILLTIPVMILYQASIFLLKLNER